MTNDNNENQGQVERIVKTEPSAKGKKRKKSKKPEKPLPPALRVTRAICVGFLKFFIAILLVFTITGCICGVALSLYVMEFVNTADQVIDLDRLKVSQTSFIYAKDASGAYQEVSQLKSGSNSVWVEFKDIPQDLKDAVVATEDKRFYDHEGVDFRRTFSAFLKFAKEIVAPSEDDGPQGGGSTITQQLIKVVNGDFYNRGVDVKIKEIIGAMNLERMHYSKDQILESYLNLIPLGYNINGVGAAAKFYFDKDISDLTLNECVALSVISKNPNRVNPITGPEDNLKRRKYAYKEMLEQKYITQSEYDENYTKELVLAKNNSTENGVETKISSYYEDSLVEQLVADLMKEYKYSKEFATQQLYTSGWKIYTPMQIETQKILEDYFADPKNFYTDAQLKKGMDNYPIPDAAYMIIMDYDGGVAALVNNKGPKDISRGLNRATSSKVARPAGSTIKPLSVYAPAFDMDIINWSTIMFDEPVMKIKDEKTGEERNYPNNYDFKYAGNISIIDAIKVSKNPIPVTLVNTLTPQYCFDFLTGKLGFTSLRGSGTNNDVTIGSMALGDGGTILSELTSAFQMFGNGGYYQPNKLYTKVVDIDGKVILDTTKTRKQRVISPDTAYIMNKALRSVTHDDGGSGRGASMEQWEVVGKTGTSNDRRDLLFVGLTPYYYAGIRYGNDDNSVIEDQGKSQMTVWKEIMEKVHTGLNPANFELADGGAIEYEYCTVSGGLAHSGCPTKKLGYYRSSYIPASCSVHDAAGAVDPLQVPKSTVDLNASSAASSAPAPAPATTPPIE